MWSFNSTIGRLFHDNVAIAFGYSGAGEGKNNPALQSVKNIGPCPRGKFRLEPIEDLKGNLIDYEEKKAPVFRLVPDPDNVMYGRSGFLLHGDSIEKPGTASEGCVIEDHATRVAIAMSKDFDFEVI